MPTLVALGAHPDDVELRCGGTLALYARRGWKTVYAIACSSPHAYLSPEDRAAGRTSLGHEDILARRIEESRRGAALLGAHSVHFLGFKALYWYRPGTMERQYLDGYASTAEDARHLLETLPGGPFLATAHHCPAAVDTVCDLLEREQADIVLTHVPDDAHAEHYATARLVCGAVRQLREQGRRAIELLGWEHGGAGSLASTFAPTHFVDIHETIDVKCEALRCFPSQFPDHNPEMFVERARRKARAYGRLAGMDYAEGFLEFQVPRAPDMDVVIPPTYDPSRAVRGLPSPAENPPV